MFSVSDPSRLSCLLVTLDLEGGVLPLTLVHLLDHTDGHGLTHITDGEATQRRVLGVRLNAHRLGGDELHNGGITGLDTLGGILLLLTSTLVDLLEQSVELARNVSGVAIHRTSRSFTPAETNVRSNKYQQNNSEIDR